MAILVRGEFMIAVPFTVVLDDVDDQEVAKRMVKEAWENQTRPLAQQITDSVSAYYADSEPTWADVPLEVSYQETV